MPFKTFKAREGGFSRSSTMSSSWTLNPILRQNKKAWKVSKSKRGMIIRNPGRLVTDVLNNQSPLKWADTTFSFQGVTSTGSLASLWPSPAGTGATNRAGPKVFIQSIQLRLQVVAAPQSTIFTGDYYNTVTLMIGESEGTFANQATSQMPGVMQLPQPTVGYKSRWLHTCFLRNTASGLATPGSAYGAAPDGEIVADVLPYNRYVTFSGTTSSSDEDKCPFLWAVSDSGTTPNPFINGVIRVYWRDVV